MLSHKRTVITGGSEGIGLGIAKAFAKNGASVLLVARDEEKLRAAAATLSSFGAEVKVLSADLSDMLVVRKTAEDMLGIWPEIDVLSITPAPHVSPHLLQQPRPIWICSSF